MTDFALFATVFRQEFAYFMLFFGAIVGSFLSMLSHRLPFMLQTAWEQEARAFLKQPTTEPTTPYNLCIPRSTCPHCHTQIAWYDNIPIISWLVLKGRCRQCHARISGRYPLTELTTALVSYWVATTLPWGLPLFAALVFSWCLIALSIIDFEHYLLPDQLTLPLLWLGLGVNMTGAFIPLEQAVIGAMGGYLGLWSLFWGYKFLTGKEGLGYGDFKLLAALGAWLGYTALPLVLFIAAITSLSVAVVLLLCKKMKADSPLPFGPYLALAGWVMLLFQESIERSYLQILWIFYA